MSLASIDSVDGVVYTAGVQPTVRCWNVAQWPPALMQEFALDGASCSLVACGKQVLEYS